jgi:SnoaL-like domain
MNETIAADGDLSALIAEMYEPDAVLEMGVLEGTFRGREGVQRFLESQIEAIGRFRTDPEDFIAAGDRVVVPRPAERPGAEHRASVRGALRPRHYLPPRQGSAHSAVRKPRNGPRSRGTVGVGDVGGER